MATGIEQVSLAWSVGQPRGAGRDYGFPGVAERRHGQVHGGLGSRSGLRPPVVCRRPGGGSVIPVSTIHGLRTRGYCIPPPCGGGGEEGTMAGRRRLLGDASRGGGPPPPRWVCRGKAARPGGTLWRGDRPRARNPQGDEQCR